MTTAELIQLVFGLHFWGYYRQAISLATDIRVA